MTFGSGYDAWLEAPLRAREARDTWQEIAEQRYQEHHNLSDEEMEEVDEDVISEWFEEQEAGAAEDAAVERAEALRDDPPDFDDDRW